MPILDYIKLIINESLIISDIIFDDYFIMQVTVMNIKEYSDYIDQFRAALAHEIAHLKSEGGKNTAFLMENAFIKTTPIVYIPLRLIRNSIFRILLLCVSNSMATDIWERSSPVKALK